MLNYVVFFSESCILLKRCLPAWGNGVARQRLGGPCALPVSRCRVCLHTHTHTATANAYVQITWRIVERLGVSPGAERFDAFEGDVWPTSKWPQIHEAARDSLFFLTFSYIYVQIYEPGRVTSVFPDHVLPPQTGVFPGGEKESVVLRSMRTRRHIGSMFTSCQLSLRLQTWSPPGHIQRVREQKSWRLALKSRFLNSGFPRGLRVSGFHSRLFTVLFFCRLPIVIFYLIMSCAHFPPLLL